MNSKHNTNPDNQQPINDTNHQPSQAGTPAGTPAPAPADTSGAPQAAPKPPKSTKSPDPDTAPRTAAPAYGNLPPGLRPFAGKDQRDPLDYESHPYPSMRRFAEFLALRFDTPRTRHSYYRQIRLLHGFCRCDPAGITEERFRDYILHVKTVRQWSPKTIRQAAAAAKLFFVEMAGLGEWKVFSQIRAKDPQANPPVLTRAEVVRLLRHIRLRRYRTPVKLIYCCGLRLSECLSLTVRDIDAAGGKLWIRKGKGNKDRMVPISKTMVDDLREYWKFHRHPLLIFPNAGRGGNDPEQTAARMRAAVRPMPVSSLQRLIAAAREALGIPECTNAHPAPFLRHPSDRAGASIHTVKALLGHAHINTTMVYLHLTHRTERDSRALIESLCAGLPR